MKKKDTGDILLITKMIHNVTRTKKVVNEIWEVSEIFDSVEFITLEAHSGVGVYFFIFG